MHTLWLSFVLPRDTRMINLVGGWYCYRRMRFEDFPSVFLSCVIFDMLHHYITSLAEISFFKAQETFSSFSKSTVGRYDSNHLTYDLVVKRTRQAGVYWTIFRAFHRTFHTASYIRQKNYFKTYSLLACLESVWSGITSRIPLRA